MVVKTPKPPKEEIFRPEEEEEELLPDIEALEQTTALTTAEIQTVISPDVLAVPPLPVADTFFSAEEAAQFGADLPIDWQLKVTAQGTVSILDPAGWEWLEGDLFVSPEGTVLNLAQVEFLYGMPEEQRILEFPTLPQVFEPVVVEVPLATRIADIETQLAGLPSVEDIISQKAALPSGATEAQVVETVRELQQQLASLKTQEALGVVFPEQDLADIAEYYFIQVEDISAVPEAERVRVEAEIALRAERWQEFIDKIVAAGRTPETEAILFAIDPGLSEDEIASIFGASPALYKAAMPILFTPDTQEALLEYFNDNPEALRSNLITIGQNTDTVALVESLFPGITQPEIDSYFSLGARAVEDRAEERLGITKGFWGDLGDIFVAGVGDLISGIGSALNWLGMDGIGIKLNEAGQFMQVFTAPDEFGEFKPEHLSNVKWWVTRGARMGPTLMLLAIPAIGAFSFAGALVTRLSMGTFSKGMLSGIGGIIGRIPLARAVTTGVIGGALSRPIESALEAGSAYDQAIAKGLSEEEARQAANKVFWNNMVLVGADVLQIGVAFLPMPARTFSSLIASGLFKTAVISGKLAFTGLTEGGEEVYQDIILRQALGEEIEWDAQMQEVFALGTMAGIGMGAGGSIIMRISSKVMPQLTSEQRAQVDRLKADLISQGLSEEVATTKALDSLEETPELTKIIEKATEDVSKEITVEQLKPKTEADKIAIDQLKEKLAIEPEVVPPVEPVEPTPIPIPPTAEAFEARLQAELVREGFPQPTREEVPRVVVTSDNVFDFWNKNLEHNPLRLHQAAVDVGATNASTFISNHLEGAGDILREFNKSIPDRTYIFEKFNRFKNNLNSSDWVDPLSETDKVAIEQTKSILNNLPTDNELHIFLKGIMLDTLNRDRSAIRGKLSEFRSLLEKFLETKPPTVEAVPPIPKAEPGMPEVGLQPSMIPEIPFKEVRPLGRGKMVQISLDDQLKLEQARKAAEEAPKAAKEAYEAQGKIEGLQYTIESDPVAQYRFKLGGKNVGLESLISIREQTFPEFFTVKQAQALNPGKAFTRYTEKGLETYNRVPRDVVLDDLTKEFGMTSDEIAERVMWIRGARQEIKNLEFEITEEFTEKPLAEKGEVTSEEVAENLTILGQPKLTLKQIDALTGFFAEYINNPNVINAWELTRELRRETLAGRAENLKARAQEYIIAEGVSAEEAMKRAITETLAGELPAMKTEYFEGLTNELRDALFAKVYHKLKKEPFEMASTVTALTNALNGKPIPTELGIRGGSAFTRLQRVFGDQPKLFRAIRKMSSERKKMTDIVEGLFRVPYQDPIPLDQKTADYLRGLSTAPMGQAWLLQDISRLVKLTESKSPKQIRDETNLLRIELAPEPTPPSLPPVEPPITEGMKQMPMIPEPQKHIILRALKEVGLTIVDIGSFMRANMASFDFSFWRQQSPLILNNKMAFLNANIYAWKSMFSQQALEASWIRITRDPLYQIYDEAGYDFLRPPPDIKTGIEHWKGIEEFGFVFGRQQRPIPRFTSKLPHVKLSARAFATGTNEHNWRIFKNHYNAMLQVEERIASGEIKLKPGEAFSMLKEMKDYARMLSDFTGRASLGKIGPAAPALAALFFSPRLNLGRLLTPRHLISSNPHVRKAAWMNLTTFVGGVGGIILLGAQLGLWEVEWDPRSPNFAQIRIGNVRFDPWGGFRPFVVFFARVLTKTGLSGATGKEYVVDPLASTAWFIRGKAAPLAAVMADFITGKTFLGDEVDVTNLKQQIERVAPFAARDLYEVYMEDPLLAIFAFVPAMLGAGIMAYSGDWEENWPKLGLPKYPENLPYGITEPVYNAKDFYSDTAKLFIGVDPETLTLAKGFPPYIKAIVEVARIKEALSFLPNQTLISINADIAEGTTFLQYYQMWLDREKIVATGDEDALKAFDADERTRNAYLGDMTQSQYALLVEYHSIIDAEKQAEFLEKHKDEIGINLRHAWLVAHPKENAQLAVWGQAKILTLEAYKEVQSLLKELDIPANALPDFLLPPEGSLETHFTYEDFVAEGKHASWEAQLLLLNDAKVAEEAGVESYAEWHELTLSDTPVRALELKVENRELSDEWNGYSDKDSLFYIDDKDLREEARDKLKTDNPEWVDDIRRIEAIENLATDETIEEWVERGKVVDEFSASSAEAKLWLIDHPETLTWALDQELLTDDGSGWNVPVLRINVEWREWDGWYDEIEGTTVEGVTFTKAQVKAQALILYPEYAMARIKRNGFSEGVPENLIDTWVEYYSLPLGKARTDFLKTHPEYYEVVWLGILENDPISGIEPIASEPSEFPTRGEPVKGESQRFVAEAIIKDYPKALTLLLIEDREIMNEAISILEDALNGIFPDETKRLELIDTLRAAVDRYVETGGGADNLAADILARAHDFLEDIPVMSKDEELFMVTKEREE